MSRLKLATLLLGIVLALAISACDSDEDDGVCLHDFGGAYECLPDFTKADCDENSWDWIAGKTCTELGYTSYCTSYSYTEPGDCPF